MRIAKASIAINYIAFRYNLLQLATFSSFVCMTTVLFSIAFSIIYNVFRYFVVFCIALYHIAISPLPASFLFFPAFQQRKTTLTKKTKAYLKIAKIPIVILLKRKKP